MKIKIIFALVVFILACLLILMLGSKNSKEQANEEVVYSDFQNSGIGLTDEVAIPEENLDKKTEDFKNFNGSIYLDKTKLMSCKNQKDGNAVIYVVDQSIDINDKITEIQFTPLSKWEPYILRDIGHLLLPGIEKSQNLPNITFTNYDEYTKVARYENGGTNGTIFYSWRLNYLIIATSIECMNDAGDTVYEIY